MLVWLHDFGVRGLLWHLISQFLRQTVSQVKLGGDLSKPWPDSGIAQLRVLSPLLFNPLVGGLAAAVQHAPPGVFLPGCVDSRFTGQLYADELDIAAESPSDLQTALNAVSDWSFRFRFRFGVGPTKSAVMVFGPIRRAECHVQLGGVCLPVVLSYKYFGVVLSPTHPRSKHVQHLVSRGNRLFAQCVSWCRAEHLPVHMASSIFCVYVLPSASWSPSFSLSPRLLCASWTTHSGDGDAGVLCELGWPDAEHLALGRLLSLLGRTLLASILSVVSESLGTWAHHALDVCSRLSIPSPSGAGVHPSPPRHTRRWVDSDDSASLNSEHRCRVQGLISRLSTARLPCGDVFSVNCCPGHLLYGGGISPEYVRLCSLSVVPPWEISRIACPNAPCLQISARSGPSGAESWSHNPWIFDSGSVHNSPGSVRAHTLNFSAKRASVPSHRSRVRQDDDCGSMPVGPSCSHSVLSEEFTPCFELLRMPQFFVCSQKSFCTFDAHGVVKVCLSLSLSCFRAWAFFFLFRRDSQITYDMTQPMTKLVYRHVMDHMWKGESLDSQLRAESWPFGAFLCALEQGRQDHVEFEDCRTNSRAKLWLMVNESDINRRTLDYRPHGCRMNFRFQF